MINKLCAAVLQPTGEQGTRLLLRLRANFAPRRLRPLVVPLLYLGEAIIPRVTLHGIRVRAERTTRNSSLEFNGGNQSASADHNLSNETP